MAKKKVATEPQENENTETEQAAADEGKEG